MKDLIKKSLRQMAETIAIMVDLVYVGLMENDAHYLDSALNKERILDNYENTITSAIFAGAKGLSEAERKECALLAQTAENLERIGDELRYLMERIELKIAENLFFSEESYEQYLEVFAKMLHSVSLTVQFLKEDKKEALDAIIHNGNEMKKLVEDYRVAHMKRLTEGELQPRASNMYFDMLDLTGNIARHCTNIARTNKA